MSRCIFPFLLVSMMLFAGRLTAQQGLVAEYYNGKNFETKAATRVDDKIDLTWFNEPPVPGINPHVCSIRWTGRLLSPETGVFTFSARVDDGIRVWVGGVLVINAWDLHDVGLFTGQVKMEKGKYYDLKVEYFNALIEGEVRLLWKLPGESSQFGLSGANPQVIESKYFYQPVIKTAPKPPAPAIEDKKPPVKSSPAPKPKEKPNPPAKPSEPRNAPIHADSLQKYIPKNVLFEQSKSTMLPESYPELDKLAGFLIRNPQLQVTIEGHTDVIGDRQKNMALSERRAFAVARYLVEKGVSGSRLEAKGYGSTRPLRNDRTKEGNEINRRVAFIIH